VAFQDAVVGPNASHGLEAILDTVLSTAANFNATIPICNVPAPGLAAKPCNLVSWASAGGYRAITANLESIPLSQYDTMDWCVFDEYDVVSDVPIPELAPYLYSAYGKGTKVIQTTRSVTDWAARRADWDEAIHANDTAPMGNLFGASIDAADVPGQLTNDVTEYKASHSANAYLYLAELAMLHCVVAPEDMLAVDIITESEKNPKQLWSSLGSFLGLSTQGLNTSDFPLEIPGECHSQNSIQSYAIVGPDGSPTNQSVIKFWPNVPDLISSLQGGPNAITTSFKKGVCDGSMATSKGSTNKASYEKPHSFNEAASAASISGDTGLWKAAAVGPS